MRILVTGAGGMLAQALVPALAARAHDVVALKRAELDVTDANAVRRRIGEEMPDAVVQCAAYTAVDAAESDAEGALLVNAEATRYVAEACHRVGARLVYPSTDYVFRGDGARPYRPDGPTAPINVYGRSKWEGERAAAECADHLVVRTSWLFGSGGPNFVDTIRAAARTRDHLDVVDDQTGRPTWTVELAAVLADLIEGAAPGIYHATGGGDPVTWYGFARHVLETSGSSTPVRPVPTSAFPRPAPRPRYSVLDCSPTERILGRPMANWRDAVRAYILSERS
jgi:dTDP-4-dehydrorhamnose reductase